MAILHTELSENLHPESNIVPAAEARKPRAKGGGDPEAEAGRDELTESDSAVGHTNGSVRYVLAESLFMASFVVTSTTNAAIVTSWAEDHTRRVFIIKYLVTLLPDFMQHPSHTTFAIAFTLYFLTTVFYSWRQHEGTCQGQMIAIALIVTIGLGLKMGLSLQSIVLSLGSWILIIALLLSRGLDVVVWCYQ
ncbi:hypothetical protein BDV97DRAFT_401698 [Delphinella strobiligena]|nr:hypothetical protein BDV97DRAFT_401698 [Delphinella strobiligena]